MDKILILLVEDNPSDVDLTQMALTKERIDGDMIVARDGVEAIEYLHGDHATGVKPLPHLILLDLKLPRMDGFSVLERVCENARTHHVPVIVVTTSNDEHTIQRCFKAGANEFVHKAPRFSEFSRALAKAIRPYIQEEEARAG